MSGPDRALVVGGARPVRRADLDEPRAGAREHVGDAEAVADLDQLAARDDDLAPLRERGEREQDGGGVVVDDERGLGAGQPAEEPGEVILARAALASLEVVLEVRVAARRPRRRGRARRRRAARGRGSCARGRRSRSARAAATACRARLELREDGVDERARARAGADLARAPGRAPSRAAATARSRGSDASRSSRSSSSTEGRSLSFTRRV